MQTPSATNNANQTAVIRALKWKYDDPRDSASGAPTRLAPHGSPPRPASPVPPLPPAEASSGASAGASSGASGRATDLFKASSANCRRNRSHIPGWAQGVNGHPGLVPKGQKESRKATSAIKSGTERRITPSNRTQFALPPLFGYGAKLSSTRAGPFSAMCTPSARKLKITAQLCGLSGVRAG